MQRRKFIQRIGIVSGTLVASASWGFSDKWKRIVVGNINSPQLAFPTEKRVPLGWTAFPVAANGARTILHFPKAKTTNQKTWLRITAANDFRERKVINASLAQSGTELGVFDIRFAHPFQPFQIEINPSLLDKIQKEGIALSFSEGKQDAWFFMPDASTTIPQGLLPQLLLDGNFDPERALIQNLCSMNSFSPFGWMGGCVQDALFEMAIHGDQKAEQMLLQQLDAYLDDEKGIVFENPNTIPIDGSFNSIEDFLPFTSIVKYYPDHKAVQMAIDYMLSNEKDDGLVATGHTTTEGCYTLAYPLAAIAIARNDQSLAQKSLQQLTLRTKLLTDEKAIYQRAGKNGPEGYANWGRGTVWYLLGMVKTLHVLKQSQFARLPDIQKVEAEFKRAATFVAQYQNTDGLWYSFLDRPATEIDTTASAGLAAAFGWGYKLGYLDEAYIQKARKAYSSLLSYITPDGFLTHVSQINRGGEDLQANGYRVISQFALGLLGQLNFILKDKKKYGQKKIH